MKLMIIESSGKLEKRSSILGMQGVKCKESHEHH
jgi:hypothetical protein